MERRRSRPLKVFLATSFVDVLACCLFELVVLGRGERCRRVHGSLAVLSASVARISQWRSVQCCRRRRPRSG